MSIDEFRVVAHQIQHELMSLAPLMNGANSLLRQLHAMKVPLALATSSFKAVMEIKTQSHRELFSVFSGIVTGDHPAVKHGKPSPDIFLEAAKQLNLEPTRCLVFEDSPTGVRAGLAANMTVIWIPDQNLWYKIAEENSDLVNHPSVHILKSLEEFLN